MTRIPVLVACAASWTLACGRAPVAAPPPSQPSRPLPDATSIEDLVLTDGGSCGRLATGRVLCWGDWPGGWPLEVTAAAPLLEDVVELAVGSELLADPQTYYHHLCARDAAGTVRCWGNNRSSQIGNGSTRDVTQPEPIEGLAGITGLALGARHSCAIDRDGDVLCWGDNKNGQVGIGRNTEVAAHPTRVPELRGVVQLAASYYTTCALTGDHRVFCWGWTLVGSRERGLSEWVPRELERGRGTRQLARGATMCGLNLDGTIRCWGAGKALLGPQRVEAGIDEVEAIAGVESIATGETHACALRGDGEVLCWGTGEHGELGNGAFSTLRSPPAHVPLPSPATRLVAGGNNTCARLSDRRWWCWGRNQNGEIGPRSHHVEPVPAAMVYRPHPWAVPTPAPLDLSQLDIVAW